MPTVKGKQLSSFKDVKVGDWVFVAWWDDPYKLLPVRSKLKKSIVVETPHGGMLEIEHAKSCWEALE